MSTPRLPYATYKAGLDRLADVYDIALGDARIEAFYSALAGLDPSTYIAAIEEAIRTRWTFPTPAVLIELADELLTEAGQAPPKPETAWVEISDLAREWRPGMTAGDLGLDDVTEGVLRQIGGIAKIGRAEPFEYSILRQDFLARYSEARRQAMRRGDYLALALRGAPAPAAAIEAGH